MKYVLPLVKIDEEKRLIYARAAAEEPDRSGEIMDYESAKPAFTEWSNRFNEATGGLSKGNVRVMHNPKGVAGKVTDLSFDDDARAVNVCMKIVDDNEWKKACEGLYTGVSVGGSYLKKWKDGDLTRYTPKIAEISLVDSPCIPSARIIELQKADGSTSEIMATGRAPRTFAEMQAPPVPRTFDQMAKRNAPTSRVPFTERLRKQATPARQAASTPEIDGSSILAAVEQRLAKRSEPQAAILAAIASRVGSD